MRCVLSMMLAITASFASAGDLWADAPAKAVEFRFAPQPGQVTRQRIVTRTVGTTRLPPPLPEIKFAQVFEQEITTTCKQVNPDRSAVMEMTMDRLAMRISSGPMNAQVDTRTFDPQKARDPMSRMMGQVLSAMTDKRVTLTLNPAGKPVKIEGMREIFERVMREFKESAGDDPVSRMLGQTFEQLGTVFEDEAVLRQMEAYYRITPNKPGVVRVGEQWDHEWQMDLPMLASGCVAKGEYELLGIEEVRGRPCAKIRLKETFSVSSRPQNPEQAKAPSPLGKLFEQMQFSLQSSGGEGVAYWDCENSTLVQLRQTQRFTLDARMPAGPETAADGTADKPDETPGLPGGQLTQQFMTSVSMDLIEPGEEVRAPGAELQEVPVRNDSQPAGRP